MISMSLRLICVITVSLYSGTVVARPSVEPVGSNVLSGSSYTINCTTRKPLLATAVCWKYSADKVTSIPIYDGQRMNREFDGRIRITNVSSSISQLTIRSAQINDTGTYICLSCSNPSESASSQLDVINYTCTSSPRSPTSEGELVFKDIGIFEINCEVTYSHRLSFGEPMVVCSPPSNMSNHVNCDQSLDCKRFINKYMIGPGTNTRYKCNINITKSKNLPKIVHTLVSPTVRAEYEVQSIAETPTQSSTIAVNLLVGGLALVAGLIIGFTLGWVLGFKIQEKGNRQVRSASLPLTDRLQTYENLQIGTREYPQDYSKLTERDHTSEANERYSRQPSAVSRSPVNADYSEIADYVSTEQYTKNTTGRWTVKTATRQS